MWCGGSIIIGQTVLPAPISSGVTTTKQTVENNMLSCYFLIIFIIILQAIFQLFSSLFCELPYLCPLFKFVKV